MMMEEIFVSETPGLHVTVVRGIHDMSCEREVVRIWTYDQHKFGGATERRVNADLLMTVDDLLTMFEQVSEFIQRNCLAARFADTALLMRRAGGH